MFEAGKSGNPSGRPKGSGNKDLLIKRLLQEALEENAEVAKAKIVEMINDENPKNLKWVVDLKAQYELKEMPNKLEGNVGVDAFVNNILDKLGASDDKSQA